MSRRLRTPSVEALLDQLEHRSPQRLPCHWHKSIDAKPLPIGGCSRDPDARWGQAVKTKAKAYKFFAIVDPGGALETWTVGPMNDSEALVARGMIKPLEPGGYLLGDALYDCNALYELASERGWQLVAPRTKPETGLGHRRHSPHRLGSIELLETGSLFGRALYRRRTTIEATLGTMGNFGCELGPLP
ncbi:MAG: transposase, partial [Planctomycetota bacterium]|nr:transposase [Planctomycetota bacterium]